MFEKCLNFAETHCCINIMKIIGKNLHCINSAPSKPSYSTSEGTLGYGSCNAVARCAPKTYNKSRAIRANASHLLQLHSL